MADKYWSWVMTGVPTPLPKTEREPVETPTALQELEKRADLVEVELKTCGGCRYHGTEPQEVWDPTFMYPGDDPKDPTGEYVDGPHRKCLKVLHGNGSVRDVKDWPAMVCDGSGYAATFWTLPTFSCALWEKRERAR